MRIELCYDLQREADQGQTTWRTIANALVTHLSEQGLSGTIIVAKSGVTWLAEPGGEDIYDQKRALARYLRVQIAEIDDALYHRLFGL